MSRIPFGPDAINMLVDLLEERGLREIELADKDARIRIVRANTTEEQAVPAKRSASSAPTRPIAVPDDAPAQDIVDSPGIVRSQLVGIAYLSPAPDATPFIKLGDKVEVGQTLLLVEAMKNFTQVVAPVSGTVAKILVATGDMVDFGMPLVVLE